LRWTDVDVEAQTISIEITRVVVDGEVVEGGRMSETSTRVWPLIPERLAALRAARMQAEEQLAAGAACELRGYVVTDPCGAALPPRHGVGLLGGGVCDGGRQAQPATRRPAHRRHAHAPGAQRAGGVATDLDTEHGGTDANKWDGRESWNS
jgi:integrase